MDKYDLVFLFGAVLASYGAIIITTNTVAGDNVGIPLLPLRIIIWLAYLPNR